MKIKIVVSLLLDIQCYFVDMIEINIDIVISYVWNIVVIFVFIGFDYLFVCNENYIKLKIGFCNKYFIKVKE